MGSEVKHKCPKCGSSNTYKCDCSDRTCKDCNHTTAAVSFLSNNETAKENKQHITIRLSSDTGGPCPECCKFLSSGELPQNIDHLINEHGFKLKSIGQETIGDNCQISVAFMVNK
ncbi:hypothetical protein C9J27_05540 [Photobacterium kishitanii]|uniref:Uncharacterized protein n=1 Tax=Photobacterium kishitanii TaxID=318456 RepID=A0A2T3KLQ6_9GAMM|nr:hypothetical protein C9J27_05540 [Photobacterium kishitanii]